MNYSPRVSSCFGTLNWVQTLNVNSLRALVPERGPLPSPVYVHCQRENNRLSNPKAFPTLVFVHFRQ